jgi:molybdopterin biosynthesis enzyme
VTFELFVKPALDLLSGAGLDMVPLRCTYAPLADDFRQKQLPLTAFVPARLEGEGLTTAVRPIRSQGSGDLGAAARADVWILIEPGATLLAAGSWVRVLRS